MRDGLRSRDIRATTLCQTIGNLVTCSIGYHGQGWAMSLNVGVPCPCSWVGVTAMASGIRYEPTTRLVR